MSPPCPHGLSLFLPCLVTPAPSFQALDLVGPLDTGAAPSAARMWSWRGPAALPWRGEEAAGSPGPLSVPSLPLLPPSPSGNSSRSEAPPTKVSVCHCPSSAQREEMGRSFPSQSVQRTGQWACARHCNQTIGGGC